MRQIAIDKPFNYIQNCILCEESVKYANDVTKK